MTDLAGWLLEQIAEDERATRVVTDGSLAVKRWPNAAPLDSEVYPQNYYSLKVDPTRMLAECEAKRRIVAECLGNDPLLDDLSAGASPEGWLAQKVLQYLALPYADRPGYLEEWRP